MILGMSPIIFTWIHVALSLIGIASGLFVLIEMLRSYDHSGMTAVFLATTMLTSVTGFLFPFEQFGPSHIVGVISLVALGAAIAGYYVFALDAAWRWIYVASAVVALYLNVFVGVVQAFQKLSALRPLAPTQSEPPFVIAQVAVLLAFIALGALAVRAFHPWKPFGLVRGG